MLGGNATERKQRRERIWGAVAFLVFAGVFTWLMWSDVRTDTSHMVVFWGCAALLAPLGWKLAWLGADKEEGDTSVLRHMWLGFAGGGLNRVLEDLRFVIGVILGASAGFFVGVAVALLAIVVSSRPAPITTTDPPGDSRGS